MASSCFLETNRSRRSAKQGLVQVLFPLLFLHKPQSKRKLKINSRRKLHVKVFFGVNLLLQILGIHLFELISHSIPNRRLKNKTFIGTHTSFEGRLLALFETSGAGRTTLDSRRNTGDCPASSPMICYRKGKLLLADRLYRTIRD